MLEKSKKEHEIFTVKSNWADKLDITWSLSNLQKFNNNIIIIVININKIKIIYDWQQNLSLDSWLERTTRNGIGMDKAGLDGF